MSGSIYSKGRKDRGGYTKNYKDKEHLFGFAVWLVDAKLNHTKKNLEALKLCQKAVRAEIAKLKKGK